MLVNIYIALAMCQILCQALFIYLVVWLSETPLWHRYYYCSHFFLIRKFFFRSSPVVWGILVSWPGTEHMPPAMGAQRLNHWTTKEVPIPNFKWDNWGTKEFRNFLFFFFFLVVPHSLWDLSSPNQGLNLGPWQWKPRSLTTEPPENFQETFLSSNSWCMVGPDSEPRKSWLWILCL